MGGQDTMVDIMALARANEPFRQEVLTGPEMQDVSGTGSVSSSRMGERSIFAMSGRS